MFTPSHASVSNCRGSSVEVTILRVEGNINLKRPWERGWCSESSLTNWLVLNLLVSTYCVYKETEHRKADRTVGVNCFVFSNISSGTAWLLQGLFTTEKRRYNLNNNGKSLYSITVKSWPLKWLTNDKITKIEIKPLNKLMNDKITKWNILHKVQVG